MIGAGTGLAMERMGALAALLAVLLLGLLPRLALALSGLSGLDDNVLPVRRSCVATCRAR